MTKYKRPVSLPSSTYKLRSGCGNMYVVVAGEEKEKPEEVYCLLGKAGGCVAALLGTLGRVISVSLQHGVPVEEITKQCKGVRCYQESGPITMCCVTAIAKALEGGKPEDSKEDPSD